MGKDPGPGHVNPNFGTLKVTYSTRERTGIDLGHFTLSSTTDKEISNRQALSTQRLTDVRQHLLAD